MIPSVDVAHVKESLALLTSSASRPHVQAILSALTKQVQLWEDAFWDVLNSRLIANSPVGDQLDMLGALVDEDRQGRADDEYLAAIILAVRVNRSLGLAEDVIAVAQLATGADVRYRDGDLYSFTLDVYALLSDVVIRPLVDAIRRARASTSSGVVRVSTTALAGVFTWGSDYAGGVGSNWGDRYGGAAPVLPLLHARAI